MSVCGLVATLPLWLWLNSLTHTHFFHSPATSSRPPLFCGSALCSPAHFDLSASRTSSLAGNRTAFIWGYTATLSASSLLLSAFEPHLFRRLPSLLTRSVCFLLVLFCSSALSCSCILLTKLIKSLTICCHRLVCW